VARRPSCAVLAVLALTALAATVSAAEPGDVRIRMAGSHRGEWVRKVVMAARERLANPECQRLFTDFQDQDGRPLQERLDTLGMSGEQFLGYVGFYEGAGQLGCGRSFVLAFTQPGSLVVRVCPRISEQDRELAEFVVLHEMLHSLGLGENPPSSGEITDQVRRRCGGRPEVRTRTARQ
jgi:hypothetical protein